MSADCNDCGRAFEFITLLTVAKEIGKIRSAVIEQNSSYYAAERAWKKISTSIRENLAKAAKAAAEIIFDLEPLILEDGNDVLNLFIQPDVHGEEGDVRDILIVRRNIHWEIGLSLKHNHFAVKHSRLAKNLDFGDRWYKIPCSKEYWEAVKPVFSYLEDCKKHGMAWKELPQKENDVYIPLLNAFKDELQRSDKQYKGVPKRMVEYLLGEYDFYKVIGIDASHTTQILTFNMRGTLNRSSRREKPKRKIPTANLPTRIVSMGFKARSSNTIEIYMDGGWQFGFRIHNASTLVEPSLKFDIQIIGMPTTIIAINSVWR